MLGQFHCPQIILQRLIEHFVFAQIDPEVIEQMFVFFSKCAVELHQAGKNILGFVCFPAGKIGQANSKIGPHIVHIYGKRVIVLIFRAECFSLVPGRIRAVNSVIELAHVGIDGLDVILRFGREFFNQFILADILLVAGGYIIAVDGLDIKLPVRVFFSKPEGFDDSTARRCTGTYLAYFLRRKHAPDVLLKTIVYLFFLRGRILFLTHVYFSDVLTFSMSACTASATAAGCSALVMGRPTTRKSEPLRTACAGVITRR